MCVSAQWAQLTPQSNLASLYPSLSLKLSLPHTSFSPKRPSSYFSTLFASCAKTVSLSLFLNIICICQKQYLCCLSSTGQLAVSVVRKPLPCGHGCEQNSVVGQSKMPVSLFKWIYRARCNRNYRCCREWNKFFDSSYLGPWLRTTCSGTVIT